VDHARRIIVACTFAIHPHAPVYVNTQSHLMCVVPLPFPLPCLLHRRVTDACPTCVNIKYLPKLKLRRLTFDSSPPLSLVVSSPSSAPLYAHQRPPPSRRASPVSIRITNVRHTREECALAPPALPTHRVSSVPVARLRLVLAI